MLSHLMVSRSKVAMAATVAELERRHKLPFTVADSNLRSQLPYMKYSGEDDKRFWTTQTDAQFMVVAYEALADYKCVIREFDDQMDGEVVWATDFLKQAGREAKRRWGMGGANRWWSACGVKPAGCACVTKAKAKA